MSETRVTKRIDFAVDEGFVNSLPKVIECNFDEALAFIEKQTEIDANLVITKNEVAETKVRCASLMKAKDAIEQQRKDIKAQWMQPYLDFEEKCKRLIAPIVTARENLWGQVTLIENNEKLEKELRLKAVYESEVGDLQRIRQWKHVFNKSWLNKTCDFEKAKAEVIAIAKDVIADVKAIRSLESNNEAALVAKYANGATLGEVLEYDNTLRAYNLSHNKQTDKATTSNQDEKKNATEGEFASESDLIEVSFKVKCTHEQLKALKNFLKSNNIEYGRA